MFSNIQREKLVELGSRFRAMYLLEQAGYTLGIAVMDGKAIEDLLPENFLKEVQDLVDKVSELTKLQSDLTSYTMQLKQLLS